MIPPSCVQTSSIAWNWPFTLNTAICVPSTSTVRHDPGLNSAAGATSTHCAMSEHSELDAGFVDARNARDGLLDNAGKGLRDRTAGRGERHPDVDDARIGDVQIVNEAEVIDIDRHLGIVDGAKRADDAFVELVHVGFGSFVERLRLGLLGFVQPIEDGHRHHSVDTGSACFASAACSVCHASVAHLTRTGNSRTPASTSSLPRSTSSVDA